MKYFFWDGHDSISDDSERSVISRTGEKLTSRWRFADGVSEPVSVTILVGAATKNESAVTVPTLASD